MESCLPWLYIITAAMLILHEMDSVYWHEWNLFRLPGGVTFFLLIHFPLLLLVFYGLLEVQKRSVSGLIISLVLALSGLTAFVIHQVFIKKGHKEFSSLLSQSILAATVIASIVLMAATITAAKG
ncbi:MAG: DUF6713 family protein [Vulcanimicrobiota bacterium]